MQKLQAFFTIFLLSVFLIIGPQLGISWANEFDQQDLEYYMKFVYDATEFPLEEHYDYIIVGGGAVGCPLAATLSAQYSVLLLERGSTPHAKSEVLQQENVLKNVLEADIDGNSPAQAFTSEEGVPNVRGRILGGGTMINAGFYSRGDEEFYINSGIEWDLDLVKKSYEWVEETIVFKPPVGTWQSSVRQALLEVGQGPNNGFTFDHIIGAKIGGSIFDEVGRRHGAVELLNKATSKNIQVAIHATVERVIFSSISDLSASGVIYSDSMGRLHRALLKPEGEVILSAGALGSPQLLLLSGVGPQPYLSSLNISVIKHHPSVGQFLADNPRVDVNIIPPLLVENSGVATAGITKDYYIEAISGSIPFDSAFNYILFPDPSPPVSLPVLTLFFKLAKPLSTGSLHLASPTDVRIPPRVSFNYFSNPEDMHKCVAGVKNLVKLMNSDAMGKYKEGREGAREFKFVGRSLPENKTDDAAFETFCHKMLTTMYHYHGGCLAGKVVDQRFRVFGIDALRVIDGSTFISSPGTNPQATLMMIGRYVGLKMQEERMTMQCSLT
ncbi:sinalpyl alcohol oxidase Nec3-like isoform X10 [Diospyros lotus]|uniref:sinalpyl alcohol oxidase Nec3-like isoform X10 n=1 Tax=Diospyros lotus TaxID=55363 RepID=UPI002256FE4F|nr:sinalpyl alcohol oxidase Nec3-like isoform X10 [Diospyros lotus]